MEVKKALQRRVGLAWLLLGLILVPAAGIILWLLVIKALPGNAVLIEEASLSDLVDTTRTVAPEPQMGTAQPILFTAPTKESTKGETLPQQTTVPVQTPDAIALTPPTIEVITVYVSGAVNKPGVYTLPAQSRVADAVKMAGGERPEADMDHINLAARISDEEHIVVPVRGATLIAGGTTPTRPPPKPTSAHTTPPQDAEQSRVNINTATTVELETLPGIGPALAGRIVEFREANGPFKTIEELTRVPGIKEAVLSGLRDFVTVGP